jgi:hypothetical protein
MELLTKRLQEIIFGEHSRIGRYMMNEAWDFSLQGQKMEEKGTSQERWLSGFQEEYTSG